METEDLSQHNLGVTTAYHLLPGMAIVIGFIVNRKRDLRIGVASHWLLNTLGSLELLMAVFR